MDNQREILYVEDDLSLAGSMNALFGIYGYNPNHRTNLMDSVSFLGQRKERQEIKGSLVGAVFDCDFPEKAEDKKATAGEVGRLLNFMLKNEIYVPVILTSGNDYASLASKVGAGFVRKGTPRCVMDVIENLGEYISANKVIVRPADFCPVNGFAH